MCCLGLSGNLVALLQLRWIVFRGSLCTNSGPPKEVNWRPIPINIGKNIQFWQRGHSRCPVCPVADLGLRFRPLRCLQLIQAFWALGSIFCQGSSCTRLTHPGLQSRILALCILCCELSGHGVVHGCPLFFPPQRDRDGTSCGCPRCWATSPSLTPCMVSVVYYCWLKGIRLNICQTPVMSPECASRWAGSSTALAELPGSIACMACLRAGGTRRKEFRSSLFCVRVREWQKRPSILPQLPLEGQCYRLCTSAEDRTLEACWGEKGRK